jgi:N-acetylmuramoyl-L-alanine amidase
LSEAKDLRRKSHRNRITVAHRDRPSLFRIGQEWPRLRFTTRFVILQDVPIKSPRMNLSPENARAAEQRNERSTRRYARSAFATCAVIAALALTTFIAPAKQAPAAPTSAQPTSVPSPAPAAAQAATAAASQSAQPAAQAQRQTSSLVILDPAHGGTDLGARGASGIRESDLNLYFAAQVKIALEQNGFQVIQTRQGNENPSFDDRSAMANAQRGAVFVSLHVGSTGLPGTARVYVMSDLPTAAETNGLIPWDRAQAPFLPLSRRFGDMVQGFLAQRFKGSPLNAQAAAVRQLRTTAAPAIAVEIASVAVEDRNTLDRMAPGIADAIARGCSGFRPLYVVAAVNPGDRP